MAPSIGLRALVVAVLTGGILAAGLLVSPSAVVGFAASLAADPVLFGAVVAGLYLLRPLAAFPTTPLSIVVGYGFGVALGVPIAMVGVVTTVIPVFLVVRWLAGGDPTATPTTPKRPFGSALERTESVVSRYYETAGPVRGVAASRLAPIPSDVSTCAAAISGVRLRHLVVGTAIGELPWTVAGVVVGASAATVTTDGLGELGLALTVACLLAAATLLAGPAYRVARARRRSGTAVRSADS